MKFIKQFSIKNFIMLFIAGVINSVGVTMFLQPVRLYDSGISGTAMLLSQVTPDWMSLSVFLIVLNIPIFLFGAKSRDGFLPFMLCLLLQFIRSAHG